MFEFLSILLTFFFLLVAYGFLFGGPKGVKYVIHQTGQFFYWLVSEAILGVRLIVAWVLRLLVNSIDVKDKKKRKRK